MYNWESCFLCMVANYYYTISVQHQHPCKWTSSLFAFFSIQSNRIRIRLCEGSGKLFVCLYVRFMRGMFFSCFLTDKHIFSACFYIENNQIIFSVFPNWIKCFPILLGSGARVRKIIILVMHFTEWNIWTIGRFIKKYDFFQFHMGNSFKRW